MMETLKALQRLRQLETDSPQFTYAVDDAQLQRSLPCSPLHCTTSPSHCHTSMDRHYIDVSNSSCKRRIDFQNNQVYSSQQIHQQLKMRTGRSKYQTPAVLRRNERERNRVKMVNSGFDTLREHVPQVADNKKISKVETLRAAVDYIKQLQELLGSDSVTQSNKATSRTSHITSCETLSQFSSSPASNRTFSPSGYSSDSGQSADDDVIEVNYENELADIAGWLQ